MQARISEHAHFYGHSGRSITLVAVSKKHPAAAISEAYACGQRDFGENYLQEAQEKIAALPMADIVWHFIGPIQSNKTRAIAENFCWAHTVDRLKIARRLSEQRPEGLPPLNICLQVNIDDEANKAGVTPDALHELVNAVATLPNLNLRGLMCIPHKDQSQNGSAFQRMRALFDTLPTQIDLPQWDTLSMGMSGDLEEAIANGSTLVRIGTDIFGPRKQ